MTETQRILEYYDRTMHGDAWHSHPVWQVLDGISVERAAMRPLANAHSIWEIVGHMAFWEEVAARRLGGLRAGLEEDRNFSAMPEATEVNWQKTLDQFRASNQAFREALQKLDPARLNELSAAGKRSFYEEAHGLIEHSVYHAGQIALLAKAANQS
jgi:uncharacterized damage-inducible protein DinB